MFLNATRVTKDNFESAIEKAMLLYSKIDSNEKCLNISKETQEMTDLHLIAPRDRYYAKANKRIANWAVNPDQYTHKIIRAFLVLEQRNGIVHRKDLASLCKDKNLSEYYVPKFQLNYYQMKIDSKRSYGKVFEDDGKLVRIWCEIEDTLRQHQEIFLMPALFTKRGGFTCQPVLNNSSIVMGKR